MTFLNGYLENKDVNDRKRAYITKCLPKVFRSILQMNNIFFTSDLVLQTFARVFT